MQTRVARRQVATPAKPRCDLTAAIGRHRDLGTDTIPIGRDTLERQDQEVAGGGSRLVIKQSQWYALADDNYVHATVVVDVADRQPAAQAEDLPWEARPL